MNQTLKKKLDNVGARFFGSEEYHTDAEFREFIYKIVDITLKNTGSRLNKLEKIVFKKYKHYSKIGNEYMEVRKNYKHICNERCEPLPIPLT